jgi:RNA polymerase sigma factor (sigma-70 family)
MIALRLMWIFAPASPGDETRRALGNLDDRTIQAEEYPIDPRLRAIVAEDSATARIAFEGLYRDMYSGLLDFAFRYVRSADLAHDVVQDVFTSVWLRRVSWAPRAGVAAYLYGAVRNRAIAATAYHRTEAQRYVMVESPNANRQYAPDEQTIHQEESVRLREAIDALPDRQRDAILLHFGRELSVAEVARTLGVSHTAATNLIARGLSRLREFFESPEK